MDSLDVMEIVVAIEDDLDIQIHDDDVETFETPRQIIDYITKADIMLS